MRVLTIILGVLLVAGGIYCISVPVATYATLSWLIGAAMLVEGIGSAITWNDRRRAGQANGWSLAGAIVSIVLGAFLLGSFAMQVAVDLFIAYIIAFWLVFAGIVRIAVAIGIRRNYGQREARGWVGLLVLGILFVILGIMCVFNPLAAMASVGFMLGISIVFVGVDLIIGGFLI